MVLALSQSRDTAGASAEQRGRAEQSPRRTWPSGRLLTLVAVGAVVTLGSMACSSAQRPAPPGSMASGTGAGPAAVELSIDGTLTAPGEVSNAFTYNPALAPKGARLAVALTSLYGITTAKFDVTGLLPDRGYAVHLHTKSCGPTGDAAGPHFQHNVDPAATPQQPSANPDFANPTNEVWLDMHTDATGSGTSTTRVPFVFTDRTPGSVVIHEHPVTETVPGQAGKAGARIACLSLSNK